MNEIFTKADFLDVFVRYNTAVGVAPWVLVGLGLLALAAVVGEWRGRDAWISGVLGALWIWSGIAFHWAFFADVNPLAGLVGVLFVGQGAAFVHFGMLSNELRFARPRRDARGFAALRLLWRRRGADEFDGREARRGSAIPHRIWRHALKK